MNKKENEQKLEVLWQLYFVQAKGNSPNPEIMNSLESMIRYINDKNVEIDKTKHIIETILPLAEKALTYTYIQSCPNCKNSEKTKKDAFE